MDNINFKKVLDDGELFDQQANYEENFEKINQEVVPKITDLEANKVDKVEGKGLSTNDFDNTYKQKIDTDIPAQLADKVQNFKLKNEIVNGDFSQGTTHWFATNTSSFSVVEGIAKFTASGSLGRITQTQLISVTLGKKYYLFADLKTNAPVSLVGYTILNHTSGYIRNVNSASIQRISGILSGTANGMSLFGVVDYRSSGFDEIEVHRVGLIDLTDLFGAGNEPTKLEMGELMKVIPNGWWDGELSLTQKQVVTWQLNLIRKNTNAIIALGGTII